MSNTQNPPTQSDETLMAFADGELDSEQRTEVERALQADPGLRQRVAQMEIQRVRVGAAFATVLDEPVPDRLTRLLQAPAASAPVVVNLADVRVERSRMRALPTWAQLGGMAASVVLGVLLGTRLTGSGLEPAVGLSQGQLVPGGAVDRALSNQLASDPAAGASVAVQLSFVDKSGNYCRTFSTAAVAGLACQQAGHWLVQQVATTDFQATGEIRQAATALPTALLDAVDKRMANGTLDGAAERAARAKGWKN